MDMGFRPLPCPICHQSANFDPAGIPGNPIWHLTPREMAWEGKTLGEIGAQIKDPARNGNRSVDALIEHIGEDHLVGWVGRPDMAGDRLPAHRRKRARSVEAWAKTGTACPN